MQTAAALALTLAALHAHVAPASSAPAPLLSLGPVSPAAAALFAGRPRISVAGLVHGAQGDEVALLTVELAEGLGGPRLQLAAGEPLKEHEVVALIPGLAIGAAPGAHAETALLPGEAERVGQSAEGVWVARLDDELVLHLDLHALDEDGLPERAAARSQALGRGGSPDALPVIEWAGDLDADGALDLIIDSGSAAGGPPRRRLWSSGAAVDGELVGLRAEGEPAGC